MGQTASQIAAPSAAPVATKQLVRADIGRERAAYTVEAQIDVSVAAREQILPLVHLTKTTLVSSTVEGAGAADARVDTAGTAVRLIVPPKGGRFRVTLYFSTALVRAAAPYVARLPVLRSAENALHCAFHGYEQAPAVEADPPLVQRKWDASTLCTTFPPTDAVTLQWAPTREAEATVHAPRAATSITTFVGVESVWSAAQQAFVPSAVLDVSADVTVEAPYVVALTKLGVLDVVVDAKDQPLHWDWLEVESDARMLTLACDAPRAPAEPVVGSRHLRLHVDVARACGEFGAAPAAPLQFTVKGRCHLALDPAQDARSVLLPVVRATAESQARQQLVYPAASHGGFQLELTAPLLPGTTSHPVGDGCILTLDDHDECIVAFTRDPARVPRAPAPQAPLVLTTLHHEVWPCAAHAMHHIALDAFGAAGTAEQTVLLFPAAALDTIGGLTAYVNGHAVRVHLEAQGASGADADAGVPVLAAASLAVPAAAVRGAHAQIALYYTTPWAPSTRLAVACPAPPAALPRTVLRVHGRGAQVPRLLGETDAHIVHGTDAVITTFPQRRRAPYTLEFALHTPRTDVRLWLALALLAACTAWWMATTSAAVHRHATQVEALAMALDIDLSDGHWAGQHGWEHALSAGHYALKDVAAAAHRLAEHLPWAAARPAA
ncbi:hypothetical protein MOBT1_002221 [Malassezia obtusa]|uniref:Uncharacterized protein n=1 Tax=Malassezia obtusa TaxID=76774 RepID=A0AAF0ISD2_9BASI|nr:hypothetical protein MOBT1_002221 [Malassezia obtusa]